MKKRLAAEWEPIKGVMITWPAYLPHAYMVDLINNYHVYMCYPDENSKAEAIQYFTKYEANVKNITWCKGNQGFDAPWVRDWGMHPIFDEKGNFYLAGAEYQMSTPFVTFEEPEVMFDAEHNPLTTTSYEQEEDKAQPDIAKAIGHKFIKLPFALTGGNIMSDGHDKLISMHVLQTENRAKGIADDEFYSLVSSMTGMSDYSILSNYADFGLQHIDCYLKMVDEETLIVSRTPEEHHLYERYENLLNNEVKKLRTRYGRPYKIYRIDIVPFNEGSDELTAYVNSIILNKTVYVPMYGIEQDRIAIEQWQEAMPGYTIKGFEFDLKSEPEIENITGYERTGWGTEDVIHCRTRAIWDEKMLYMSLMKLPEAVTAGNPIEILAEIIDYSGEGLVNNSEKLIYRLNEGDWQEELLAVNGNREEYLGKLNAKAGDKIDYYIQAKSQSGRKETMPRVAPKGFYTTIVK